MPALKGTEGSLFYVQCFLYLVSCSINVSIFHITWLDTFWTDFICTTKDSVSQLHWSHFKCSKLHVAGVYHIGL